MNKYNIKVFVPMITSLITRLITSKVINEKLSGGRKTSMNVTNIDDKKLFKIISKEMLIN
jgi:hypothetical protein